jgi:putative inorganic carbon (hco3(-)) transporter
VTAPGRTGVDLVSDPAAQPPGLRALVADLSAWSGHRLVTLGLLLMCFSNRWHDLGVPVPLDRPVLVLGLGLCTVRFFAACGRITIRPVHVLMTLAVAWAGISAISVGSNVGPGLFALIDRFGLLPFFVFALAPAVYATPESRSFLARTFTLFGLYLGVTALAQMLGVKSLVWPGYILDPSVGIHFGRARGPFVESVGNGLMLIYSGAMAGVVAATDRSRAWRRLAVLTIGLTTVGVVLTLTRAIWLGAAVAAIATVVAVPRLRRFALVIGVGAVGVVVAAFLTVPGLGELASDRSGDQSPLWDRYNTNWAALRMLEQHPLTGVGWSQARFLMADFVRQGETYPVTAATAGLEVHNVFLSRLAELGIVGAFLFFAAFAAAAVYPLLRRARSSHELEAWRAALLPVVIAWCTAAMFGPLTYAQPNYMVWALAGVASVAYLGAPRAGASPADPPDVVPPRSAATTSHDTAVTST